jgi:short-subunit dehydrogenase involved in D-alanine esterification of teichoic acids
MKLRSNTILITGGGSGIGYELTKQLTALGNTILIVMGHDLPPLHSHDIPRCVRHIPL